MQPPSAGRMFLQPEGRAPVAPRSIEQSVSGAGPVGFDLIFHSPKANSRHEVCAARKGSHV